MWQYEEAFGVFNREENMEGTIHMKERKNKYRSVKKESI